jgi:dihydroorotate dehydrogenase electron transfer subunit
MNAKKVIDDLLVIENKVLNVDYFILTLQSRTPLPEMFPGQFAEVKVENNAQVFLRRPISIHDVDNEKNQVALLVRIVGEGTQTLSKLKKDDVLNMVYPLGNTFNTNDIQTALLIGGGCGIAPMLFLARKLKSLNVRTSILIGGRTSADILEADKFSAFGRVCISTDDGSLGEKGFLTNHSVMKQLSDFDRIFTCGPEPMMKVVAGLAKTANIDCEVSLENMMACGIGACLCCVTETKSGNKCVCTDGPVFNINSLSWQI